MELKQNKFSKISELIEYSHAMLRHAEAGEWEALVKNEAIRRELINSVFSQFSNADNDPDISSAIQELLQINKRLEQVTTEARDRARGEANTISHGRKAVNAYADNAR
jgi:hypothetical protein